MRSSLTACASLLILIAGVTQGCGDSAAPAVDGLLKSESAEGRGELCVPVDEGGTGSFAWETIRNTSSEDVRVVGVHVSGDGVKVVDWFLARIEWEGGVRSGRFPPQDRGSFPSEVLTQGEDALIAFSLQVQEPPNRSIEVVVDYKVSDASGTLPLNWRARLVPAGESCHMNG